tara:strand:+ start:1286 stop:1684 length:399 start_codon:yes stop_codon:yes gene_type:complete
MDQLNAISALLHGPGTPMVGYEKTDEEAIELIHERFSGLPYCLVRHWIWIDLDVPDAIREELIRTQRQPVMLYAHEVVYDSLGRFNRGDWARSTPLLTFAEECLFQTRNTVYMLLGPGERKHADLSTVALIS